MIVILQFMYYSLLLQIFRYFYTCIILTSPPRWNTQIIYAWNVHSVLMIHVMRSTAIGCPTAEITVLYNVITYF